MKCKDCKYWKLSSTYGCKYITVGDCSKVKMMWDSTEWTEDGEHRSLIESAKDDLAFVQDGSDYRAILLTLPDFGCVQFEENKNE